MTRTLLINLDMAVVFMISYRPSAAGVPEWEWRPYFPGGTVQSKVIDSSMANTMELWAQAGHHGSDFLAGPFLKQHPEYDWMRGLLRDMKCGSSGGSVQALKKVDVLAQSVVGSITLFRLETQHVHQLVVPCVRDSGIHLHSDSLRWRNHPLCHRPGEKTVVLLVLRLVGSTPTWSNRENVSNPPHRTQTRGHSLRGSARPLRVLRSDPTGRDWVCG